MVIGVWLHRDRHLQAPPAMDPDDLIVFWNTDEIAAMLEHESDEFL